MTNEEFDRYIQKVAKKMGDPILHSVPKRVKLQDYWLVERSDLTYAEECEKIKQYVDTYKENEDD